MTVLTAVIAIADVATFVVALLILLLLKQKTKPLLLKRLTDYERPGAPYAYVIWCWKGDRWELDRGSVPAGAEPGPPPSKPGEYPNHMVRVPCYQA